MSHVHACREGFAHDVRRLLLSLGLQLPQLDSPFIFPPETLSALLWSAHHQANLNELKREPPDDWLPFTASVRLCEVAACH